jgi:transcriptional regulator with XRE-family HTH domain
LPKASIDVRKLYEALDVRRTVEGLSWRQLAGEIGVSPSLLSRLRHGLKPDIDSFATLVRWLGSTADEFLTSDNAPPKRGDPALETQVGALLRSRKDLDETDRKFLQEIFTSALKRVREDPTRS